MTICVVVNPREVVKATLYVAAISVSITASVVAGRPVEEGVRGGRSHRAPK